MADQRRGRREKEMKGNGASAPFDMAKPPLQDPEGKGRKGISSIITSIALSLVNQSCPHHVTQARGNRKKGMEGCGVDFPPVNVGRLLAPVGSSVITTTGVVPQGAGPKDPHRCLAVATEERTET